MPTAYIIRYDLDYAVRMEFWENRTQAFVRACQMLVQDLERGVTRGLDDEKVLGFLSLIREGKFDKAVQFANDHMTTESLTVEAAILNINPFLSGETQRGADELLAKLVG